MRDLVKLIFGGLLLFQFSCSKSDNTIPQGPTINSPSPIPDGLSFPVTQGSYWEYQRIDTSEVYYGSPIPGNFLYFKADTTKEVMTLVGDTLITEIDPIKRLLNLQIKNLTNGNVDTILVLYTTDRIAFYSRNTYGGGSAYFVPNPPYGVGVSTNFSIWAKHETIYFPITNFYIPSNNRYTVDTTFIIKDTSISTPANTFNNCIYAEYVHSHASFAASGVGGYSQWGYTFLKPGVGIILQHILPISSQGTAFDRFYFRTWTVRRLVNYKIN